MITKEELKKAKKLEGKIKDYTFNNMTIKVNVLEVKLQASFIVYKISPVNGSGFDYVQKFTKSTKRVR